MEAYSRALKFEVDRSGIIVRVHAFGTVPCGAANFVGLPLAEAVKPTGLSAGPVYHGVLGGGLPCRYEFTAGLRHDTVDVQLPMPGRANGAKGSFATYARMIEIVQAFEHISCAFLVVEPSPVPPETEQPGLTELCLAQQFLHDRLAHPLGIVARDKTRLIAVLPCTTRRVLEAKFVGYDTDCRIAMSDRFSWTAGFWAQKTPFKVQSIIEACLGNGSSGKKSDTRTSQSAA